MGIISPARSKEDNAEETQFLVSGTQLWLDE